MSSRTNVLRRLATTSLKYRRRKQRKHSLSVIAGSELFDRAWYLQMYPDVRDSGVDPVRHYLESGWREGRNPGPDFCTTAYLKANSDVAALGINPLLHFLEHGRFEGRGASHPNAPFRAAFSPEERFGPAAPCPSFDPPPLEAVQWTRAGRIAPAGQSASIGGLTIAQFDDEVQRQSFDQALKQLAWLSGQPGEAIDDAHTSGRTILRMRNAWHAGRGILRTRWWSTSSPIVVRAIQHAGERPAMVGEGCVTQHLDLVDVRAPNPYYPLLFVFTAPDGRFLGFRKLTFPALCRGGLYYPELLALARAHESVDIATVDEQLAARLVEIRTGAPRSVGRLEITLKAADGTHPLFQAEYKRWLANVVQIAVNPTAGHVGPACDYLASAVQVEVGTAPARGPTLRIAGDMVPTISALLMLADAGGGDDELAGSMIVVSPDANIGTLVQVPSGTPAAAFGAEIAVPIVSAGGLDRRLSEPAPLLAICLPPRRPVHDAELLVSHSETVESSPGISVTWFLWPDQWREPELLQSLEALAQQTAELTSLIFIGGAPKAPTILAEELFTRRARIASTALEASKLTRTDLIGYLGSGIIPHDRRTTRLLASALKAPDAVTASPLVVSAERRGKGTLVIAADGPWTADARLMAHAIVPISEPGECWIGRTEVVRNWIEQTAENVEGRHVCATDVAVSRLGRTSGQPAVVFPRTPAHMSISIEPLIG